MHPLGPFGPAPRLAVAVSGGADSLALALLAEHWVRARHGALLALVVDHGLRAASGAEARLTLQRLAALGIAARCLTLAGLRPAAAAARRARYAALEAACGEAGIVHLLLGHHAGDQAETLLLRRAAGSGPRGLAAMAAVREETTLALLRPLLAVPPGRLRATLRTRGLAWVEDPTNQDLRHTRARLRAERADPAGDGPDTARLLQVARAYGAARRRREAAVADELAARVSLYPEGFAWLSPGPLLPDTLAALLRALGGAPYAPAQASLAALARAPRAATLGGVRLLPAGRFGDGWLLLREAAAMQAPVPARPCVRWDGRFCLGAAARPPAGAMLGALGARRLPLADRAGQRRLPAAVRATLPALFCDGALLAVPHLCYPDAEMCAALPLLFAPPEPVRGAGFGVASLNNGGSAMIGDAQTIAPPYVPLCDRSSGRAFRLQHHR